ncbi:c-type cytochrome [Cesiribacter andamanensis]|uniref:Cytochrome c, mono-and diheme variant n=1 Tax=Cesiribacter andamanensis AMV16 TaxID=1279009 RepID=M7N3Z0_9BACT|nr:c-type cytochrome [Cesiribacter andamanensis]EMR03383.1 Cytochrome c, mono- and diheme variant [Cesiribacter andamanensis AMV16]
MKHELTTPDTASKRITRLSSLFVLALGCFFFISCSSGTDKKAESNAGAPAAVAEPVDDGKGIGPVKHVTLSELDPQLAEQGKNLYEGKCSACHRLDGTKVVGPGLAGITDRRSPEWIMNMIINPEEMTKKDPTAKKLLAEHLTQMTNQNVTEQDARAMLEYFRQLDASAN